MDCWKCKKPLVSKADTYISAYPPGPFVLGTHSYHQACFKGKKNVSGEWVVETEPVKGLIVLLMFGVALILLIRDRRFDGLFYFVLILFILGIIMFSRDRRKMKEYDALP